MSEPASEAQSAPPVPPSIASGVDVLVYHAALLQLVQATQAFVAVIDRVGEAARRVDPSGSAEPRVEELAAVEAVQAFLRAAVERNPGMVGVFAAAAGNLKLAIPG